MVQSREDMLGFSTNIGTHSNRNSVGSLQLCPLKKFNEFVDDLLGPLDALPNACQETYSKYVLSYDAKYGFSDS